jgi:hypothetical protein
MGLRFHLPRVSSCTCTCGFRRGCTYVGARRRLFSMQFARGEEDGTGTSGDARDGDEGFLHTISFRWYQLGGCTYLAEQRSEGHCAEDAGAMDGVEDVRAVVVRSGQKDRRIRRRMARAQGQGCVKDRWRRYQMASTILISYHIHRQTPLTPPRHAQTACKAAAAARALDMHTMSATDPAFTAPPVQ